MWKLLSVDIALQLKQGDILAPRFPVNENSAIYTVINVVNDGNLALVNKPVHFTESVRDLAAGRHIKPDELVNNRWWYFAIE